jgi:hypothetical protein
MLSSLVFPVALRLAPRQFAFPGGSLPSSSFQADFSMTRVDHSVMANAIRALAMDAVQKANSGHPGTPMALAPAAYCLWQNFLRYDPQDPHWSNRDRFVLSNGHASMLLYSLLHLSGVREVDKQGNILSSPAVSLDDISPALSFSTTTSGPSAVMAT